VRGLLEHHVHLLGGRGVDAPAGQQLGQVGDRTQGVYDEAAPSVAVEIALAEEARVDAPPGLWYTLVG
jgi:hypothetical protein